MPEERRLVGDFESPDFLLSFKHFFGNFKNIIYVTLGMGSTGKCHPQQFHALGDFLFGFRIPTAKHHRTNFAGPNSP